jgi:hypothetical protein
MIRLIAAAGLWFYLGFCAIQLISVATASPADVDRKAGEAINAVTNATTNQIIDEVTNPISIINYALQDPQ